MSEWVTVTPLGGKDPITGDQLPDGTPLRLMALEVAPGNTLLRFGIGGDLDSVEFTTYLPLRHRGADGTWTPSAAVLSTPFRIEVRDRKCLGRMQEWNSRRRGGIAVLCHSATGKGA